MFNKIVQQFHLKYALVVLLTSNTLIFFRKRCHQVTSSQFDRCSLSVSPLSVCNHLRGGWLMAGTWLQDETPLGNLAHPNSCTV